MPSIFCDSEIAKKISCGRTKSEKIVCGVLAPKALQKVLLELKNGFERDQPILVFRQMHQTKKNRKMFPVVVTYFRRTGRCNALIDFYEDHEENTSAIFGQLKNSITKNGLDMRFITSYHADNASVNFGCKSSVFT